MYNLKIEYITGDSFSKSNTYEILDLEWSILPMVKMNLRWIKEHHEMYKKSLDIGTPQKRKELFDFYKTRDWFVNSTKYYDTYTHEVLSSVEGLDSNNYYMRDNEFDQLYQMKLVTDNGNLMQLGTFWIGTFESLIKAEIIFEDEDLVYEP